MKELAEFPAAHEIILLSFDLAHGPDSDGGHAGEVDKENEVISKVHRARVSSKKDTDPLSFPNKKTRPLGRVAILWRSSLFGLLVLVFRLGLLFGSLFSGFGFFLCSLSDVILYGFIRRFRSSLGFFHFSSRFFDWRSGFCL